MWKLLISLIDWFIRRAQYKSRMEEKADTTLACLQEHNRRLLRLEIDAAMRRDDRAVVHQLYDEYRALGGNSYMQEVYKEYCKKRRSKK